MVSFFVEWLLLFSNNFFSSGFHSFNGGVDSFFNGLFNHFFSYGFFNCFFSIVVASGESEHAGNSHQKHYFFHFCVNFKIVIYFGCFTAQKYTYFQKERNIKCKKNLNFI